ncbi:MAG: PH domain-containing protein [Armatimonadota bacterium]
MVVRPQPELGIALARVGIAILMISPVLLLIGWLEYTPSDPAQGLITPLIALVMFTIGISLLTAWQFYALAREEHRFFQHRVELFRRSGVSGNRSIDYQAIQNIQLAAGMVERHYGLGTITLTVPPGVGDPRPNSNRPDIYIRLRKIPDAERVCHRFRQLVSQAKGGEDWRVFCRRCGNLPPRDAAVCPFCGTPAAQHDVGGQQPRQQNVPPPVRVAVPPSPAMISQQDGPLLVLRPIGTRWITFLGLCFVSAIIASILLACGGLYVLVREFPLVSAMVIAAYLIACFVYAVLTEGPSKSQEYQVFDDRIVRLYNGRIQKTVLLARVASVDWSVGMLEQPYGIGSLHLHLQLGQYRYQRQWGELFAINNIPNPKQVYLRIHELVAQAQ